MSGCQPRTSCPRPLNERTLSPSLATTHAKASERVIADPLGWEKTKNPTSLLSPGRSHTSARSSLVQRVLSPKPRDQMQDKNVSHFHPVPHSKPGTQCHTSAKSLRKQISKLSVSDPRYRAANKDVSCRHCAMDGAFGGHPVPQRQEFTRLVCSASYALSAV